MKSRKFEMHVVMTIRLDPEDQLEQGAYPEKFKELRELDLVKAMVEFDLGEGGFTLEEMGEIESISIRTEVPF